MPVDLSIVESTTELGQTVVEVILESASEPGPAGPGVPAGGTLNQVLTKDSGTDYDTSWQDAQGGGGGAPDDATYLVTTAHGDLSAEVVVGATPGGELGGTWPSPTVDATHSGSSHAAVQAAAEATAAAALLAHTSDGADRHPADNISTVPAGGLAATEVQAALNELDAEKAALATFNDHSARHEDGGPDEISIAGLAGTSVALQAHLDDAADAHDASAVSVDSTTLSGTGTTVQASLEELDNLLDDHSSRHENGGADEISIAGLDGTPTELTNHLNDAADAHDASAISIADAGAFYTATEVEAVLQEIGPQLGGSSDWDATVVKQADETITNNTTLQNDNELAFAVVNGAHYHFELVLVYHQNDADDIKHAFTISSGAFQTNGAWRHHVGIGPTTAVIQHSAVADMTTAIVNATTTDGDKVVEVKGAFTPTADATVTLQWAQNTADAVNGHTVRAGSLIRYRRLQA